MPSTDVTPNLHNVWHSVVGWVVIGVAAIVVMFFVIAGLRLVGLLPKHEVYVIQPGKDVAIANVAGSVDFFGAVAGSNVEDAKRRALSNPQLLKAGDATLATALHRAVEKGDVPMVQMLLALHAPTEFRDASFQSTPLGWAVSWGRVEVVKTLLAHGAAVEPKMYDSAKNGANGTNTWSKEPRESYAKIIELLAQHDPGHPRL